MTQGAKDAMNDAACLRAIARGVLRQRKYNATDLFRAECQGYATFIYLVDPPEEAYDAAAKAATRAAHHAFLAVPELRG